MIEHASFDPIQANLRAGQRAAALYKEAQTLADENVVSFIALLQDLVQRAGEIAEGGDIYAIGIRDICKKLGEQTTFRAQAIASITHQESRNGPSPIHGSLEEADLTEELARADDMPVRQTASSAISFSPFVPLEPADAEPTKIVTLHRTVEAAPADLELSDFSEITERLSAFGRRAAGFEAG
jgi:hypothetical protein